MAQDLAVLGRRWFEEVWNQRRDATIDELLDPGVQIFGLSEDGQPAVGPELFRKFYASFVGAFPDLRVTVQDVLVDGDKSVVRLSMTGKHTGDHLGLPATGNVFTSTAIIIMRWRDGRIVEGWNEFDAAGMMLQLSGAGKRLRA